MSGLSEYTVALIQLRIGDDARANTDRAVQEIEKAALAGARVVCLPELFRSRYFCQREDAAFFDLAEPIPGPTMELMSGVARRNRVVLVVPLFEKRGPGLYHNSAAVLDADGSLAGLYRKMHIPDDPGYYEKFYFAPGDLGFRVFSTEAGRLAVLICWDQWFPEAARLAALAGAEIVFYPTAIGWHPREKAALGARQLDAWRTVQRGHAIANGVYVAAVNRVGLEKESSQEEGIEFWGSSFLCDPQGVLLAEAPADTEAVLTAQVCPSTLEQIRRDWPFLRDRRVDAYGDMLQRYLDSPAPTILNQGT